MIYEAERKNQNWLKLSTVLKCLTISALILVGVNYKIVMVTAVIVACVFIIFSDTQEIMEFLMYTAAFSVIFKLSPSGFTFYNIVIMTAIFKLAFIIKKFSISKQLFGLFILFSIFIILSGGRGAISELIKMLLYLILIYLFLQQKEPYALSRILISFSLGIILASLAGYFHKYIPGLDSFMRVGVFRFGDEHITRFGGLSTNPNFFTMPITIALSCLLGYIVTRKAGVTEYILFIILTVFGVSSVSMSFLISLVVMIIIGFIYVTRKNLKSMFISLFVILLIFFVVYIFSSNQFIQSYIMRLTTEDTSSASDLTTGRTDIWLSYFQLFLSNLKIPIFGRGLGSSVFGTATHNTYIDIIYYIGIFGGFLYLFILKCEFPKKEVPYRKTIINYLPLVMLSIRSMAISYLLDDNIYMFYILIYLMINTDFSEKKQKLLKISPDIY